MITFGAVPAPEKKEFQMQILLDTTDAPPFYYR